MGLVYKRPEDLKMEESIDLIYGLSDEAAFTYKVVNST
jgi:hypothetical protein